MMKTEKTLFIRLPKKNKEEIKRLLNSLIVHLKEIREKANAIKVDQIRKGLIKR